MNLDCRNVRKTVKYRDVPEYKKDPISLAAYRARQLGLSYGKYMALKHEQERIALRCPRT